MFGIWYAFCVWGLCKKMTGTDWQAILVNIPKKGRFQDELAERLPGTVNIAKLDLEDFVANWRASSRPKIKIKLKKEKNRISALAGVESNWTQGQKAKPQDILMFNTRGTDVRYATMDTSFRAKTKYRVVKSSGGSGRGTRDPVYISKDFPQPGIQAREIEEAIYDQRRGQIIKKMQEAVKLASKKAKL